MLGRTLLALLELVLAAHADRARAPVDVVEPEPGDFTAPQAEPNQQGQDRQIAATDGSIGIARSEKASHLIGLEPLGQPGHSAAQDRRHGRDERAPREPFGGGVHH